MKIEHIEVYGFRSAFRGMRNPRDSWDRSDSKFFCTSGWQDDTWDTKAEILCVERPVIGPKDMELACKLIKGSSEQRKFLRQIQIWFDITIPRYIWQELDTYKIATVRNSCSSMHKIGSTDLTQDDFELPIPSEWLKKLNAIGDSFRYYQYHGDTENMKRVRREYKNRLPEGFLQKATYTMNYETALSMYFQRKNHRLPEWRADKEGSICSFIGSLPYMTKFLAADKRNTEGA